MRRRIILLACAVALGGDGCNPEKKTKKPASVIVAPKMPAIKGQCGIGAAGPGTATDCHPPYTYQLTADSRGISITTVVWRLGPHEAPLDHGGPDERSGITVTRRRMGRVPAAIQIYARQGATFAPKGRYGTGCTISVRDAKGEQVGIDTIVTRPKVNNWVIAPYDHSDCVWG